MIKPIEITNADFLAEIFGKNAQQAWVTGFLDDPLTVNPGRWTGRRFGDANGQLRPNSNNYFCISLFNPRPKGEHGSDRKKSLFRETRVIVLDDMISKVDPAAIPLEPSYKLETSPGNEQWGYLLSEPCTDRATVERFFLAGEKQLSLTGGEKGVTRYVRLPVGRNTKPNYGKAGFKHRLVHWNPRVKFHILTLAERLGLDLKSVEVKDAVTDTGEVDRVSWLIRSLENHGLVKGYRGNIVDVSCPWIDDHSERANSGTAIIFYDHGPVFKCNHGHCKSRTLNDVTRWLKAQEAAPPPPKIESISDICVDDHRPEPGADSYSTALPPADENQARSPSGPVNKWKEQPIPQRIDDLLLCYPGKILTNDFVAREIGVTGVQRNHMRVVLSRLVEKGRIVHMEAGQFLVPDSGDEDCDWMAEDICQHLDVYLPFGLDSMVNVEPGSQMLLSGAPNAGKSAVGTNIAYHNAPAFKIRYLSTEYTPGDFKRRMGILAKQDRRQLSFYRNRISFKKLKTIEGVHLKVSSDPKTINIIDYIEIYENFYAVGKMLSQIHSEQGDSFTVVCIQKKTDERAPLGGHFSLWKPHLGILLDPMPGKRGKATAAKVKQYQEGYLERNPPIDGKCFYYGFDPSGSIVISLAGGKWLNPSVEVKL